MAKSHYQIDQSIKIENTQKASYVCLANSQIIVCSISAYEKRKLKSFFRDLSKPLIFKLFTFSYLCSKIIIISKVGAVTIDQEYIGHEREIKSFIVQIFEIEGVETPVINFSQIGKASSAHKGAYNAFKSKKSDIKITSGEVLKYYEKINKG